MLKYSQIVYIIPGNFTKITTKKDVFMNYCTRKKNEGKVDGSGCKQTDVRAQLSLRI